MKISFDLDDTLFVSPGQCPVEKPLPFQLHLIFRERLRLGTISIFQKLHRLGVSCGIYTTSFRTKRYIRALFRCYGIQLDFVINGSQHDMDVQRMQQEAMPSKYPSHYRIDLHVDDDISVSQNGQIYGFRVFLMKNQENWTDLLLSEVQHIQK